MPVPGKGVELYGSQEADHYTHIHNYYFHVKQCEVFDETPLPVMGPTGFLTKGISFSPFIRNKWPEMGELKPLNGTNLPAPPPIFNPATPHPSFHNQYYFLSTFRSHAFLLFSSVRYNSISM